LAVLSWLMLTLRQFLHRFLLGQALGKFDAVAAVSFVHQSVGLGNARRWRERDFVCPSRARTRHIGGGPPRGFLLRSLDCAAPTGLAPPVPPGPPLPHNLLH